MKPWGGNEIGYVRRNAALGAEEIAHELERSPAAVRSLAHRLRISLRRKGSRRGSVLGQARGSSIRAALRDDVLAGRVNATMIAERIRIDAEAELCPQCTARPIRVASSGLCRVCHDHALADAHREALAELEARRGVWTHRQRLKRARGLEAQETAGAGYGTARA